MKIWVNFADDLWIEIWFSRLLLCCCCVCKFHVQSGFHSWNLISSVKHNHLIWLCSGRQPYMSQPWTMPSVLLLCVVCCMVVSPAQCLILKWNWIKINWLWTWAHFSMDKKRRRAFIHAGTVVCWNIVVSHHISHVELISQLFFIIYIFHVCSVCAWCRWLSFHVSFLSLFFPPPPHTLATTHE